MGTTSRLIHPSLNPTGLMASAGAIYAGASMAYNAYNHHGAWSTPVFIALVGAVSALLTRQVVTPVADPKDGNGNPLVPLPLAPVVSVTGTPDSGTVRIVAQPPAEPPGPAGG